MRWSRTVQNGADVEELVMVHNILLQSVRLNTDFSINKNDEDHIMHKLEKWKTSNRL